MAETEREAPGFERIVPKGSTLETIAEGCVFTEGPVWNAREKYFLCTDIIGDRIIKWTPQGGVTTFMDPSGHANGMTYDRQGRLVVAGYGSRNIWRMGPDGHREVLTTHYQGMKIHCPNDIVVRSDGYIYWTESTGGLYHPGMHGEDVQQYLDFKAIFCLSPDGSTLTPVVMDFEGPNGIAFSPDESLLYINDTRRRHIRVFDVQRDGTLANGRVFYEARGEGVGNPDGMKVDVEGNVYCTGPGGIHVIDPEGELLGVIRLTHPSNMAWGDDDWQTLYITRRDEVHRLRLGIPGVPVGPAS